MIALISVTIYSQFTNLSKIMKSPKSILAIAAATIGMMLVANAFERHGAASESAQAMDTIAAGKGWNGEDITPAEQNERMAVSADLFSTQKSQRNTRGFAGVVLLGAGLVTFRSARKRK